MYPVDDGKRLEEDNVVQMQGVDDSHPTCIAIGRRETLCPIEVWREKVQFQTGTEQGDWTEEHKAMQVQNAALL